MGLFGNRKNTATPASVLSESEIQKKLYGEFNAEAPHAVFGEREHFKESASLPSRRTEFPPKKEGASDLFNTPGEAATESAPRIVPSSHIFEKNLPSAPLPSSGPDPYARFPYNRPAKKKAAVALDLLKGISGKGAEFVRAFLDPKQVVLRRVFYWGAAGMVIFLLFFGVNALNSQREIAMRTRYKIPAEAALAPVAIQTHAAVSAAALTESPVIITPIPVRPKKSDTAGRSGTTVVPASGSFVIQVVTYPTREDASQVVSALKREGFHAYVTENTRPSGRLFYLVLIGGFRTEAEAQAQLLKFRAKEIARPFQDAFVKTGRS